MWLYNSPTDSHLLGFVNPGVGNNGRSQTAGALPTNASHFKQLLVTLRDRRRKPDAARARSCSRAALTGLP